MVKILQKGIANSFEFFGKAFLVSSKIIYKTKQDQRVKPWFNIDGDNTLRVDYPLTQKSIVFDLGGYEGKWTSDIYSRYGSKIYIFEPVLNYYKNIQKRFIKNKDIKVFPFGLSNEDKKILISVTGDDSSQYKSSFTTEQCQLKDVDTFITKYQIKRIDLMKINIEGGEYDLLERLIETDRIKKINNIQIQFHDFAPDAENRMKKIQKALKKTHRLTYQFEFVWENWQLK